MRKRYRTTQTSPSAGHGNFLPWIGAEFGMSKSTVENFMNVSDAFGNKIPIFGNLSASARGGERWRDRGSLRWCYCAQQSAGRLVGCEARRFRLVRRQTYHSVDLEPRGGTRGLAMDR